MFIAIPRNRCDREHIVHQQLPQLEILEKTSNNPGRIVKTPTLLRRDALVALACYGFFPGFSFGFMGVS